MWYLGDFVYSIYANWKLDRWERSVQRDANGVLVGCEAFSAGDGDTALLLVPGINDTPFTYRKMAGVLMHHFHVRAMRLPGFGQPVPIYGSCNAEDWVAALTAEVVALGNTHERVFVVAHSLGAAVALRSLLAADQASRDFVNGLILLAPAIEVSNRRSPLLPVRWWHRLSAALVFTKFTVSPFPPDMQDPAFKDFPNRTPFTPRSVIDGTFRLIDANRGREREIDIPVLLVLSERDEVIDQAAAKAWFDELRSSPREVYWNNRSGHQLHYDLGWEDVAGKITAFAKTSM